MKEIRNLTTYARVEVDKDFNNEDVILCVYNKDKKEFSISTEKFKVIDYGVIDHETDEEFDI